MDDTKNNSVSNSIVRNRAALEHTTVVEKGLLANGDEECNLGKHSNGVCVISSTNKPRDCWNFCKNRPILMCAFISFITIVLILLTFFIGKWSNYGVSCSNLIENVVRNETHRESSVVDSTNRFTERLSNFAGTPIVRLSTNISPIHYDLSFNLRTLHERRFTGSVSIHLRCNNDTDMILLHAGKEVTLDNVELFTETDGRKTEMKILKLLRLNKSPLLTIQVKHNMKQDSFYILKIDFSSIVCGERTGFVCGNNEYVDSPEKVFMATKFEPNFARTAFPCFDEPHLKATFNLSVVRTREMTVLTNTPSLK